jgi:hypothetical protein
VLTVVTDAAAQRRTREVLHAIVQDVAASWVEYERVAGAVVDATSAGLILHVAGPTDEGVRTIDVWESEAAWQRFRAERLTPAIVALGSALRLQPSLREFHPLQLVIGRRAYVWQAEPPAKAAPDRGGRP